MSNAQTKWPKYEGYPVLVSAQPKFEHVATDLFPSKSAITSIVHDDDGFMWFGSFEGLYRYDGYRLVQFKSVPFDSTSLSRDAIRSLLIDQQGVLWVGTGDGLNEYDPSTGKFVVYRHNLLERESATDDLVRCLFQDRDGNLWVGRGHRPGISGGGLHLFDTKAKRFARSFHASLHPDSLRDDLVTSIAEDTEGILWIGTYGGLNRFDKKRGSFTNYRHDPGNPHSLNNHFINSVLIDRQGMIWAGTSGGGLNKFDAKTEKFTAYKIVPHANNHHDDNVITTLYEDLTGNLWVGTRIQGLCLFDPKNGTFTQFKNDPQNPATLNSNTVLRIYSDGERNLWIATTAGVDKLHQEPSYIERFDAGLGKGHSLSDNSVNSLLQDADGNIWVGTDSYGLNKIDRKSGRVSQYFHDSENPFSITSNRVESIVEESPDVLWIGTIWGVSKFDKINRRFTSYKTDGYNPYGLTHNNVYALLYDQASTLWVGTADGLNQWNLRTQKFRHYKHDKSNPNSLSHDGISALYQDRSGKLWIGTRGRGLNVLDPANGAILQYVHDRNDHASLSNDAVWAILEDTDGVIWVGTQSGLNRLDPRATAFKYYFVADGLPDNYVSGLVMDKLGRLWIFTKRGLTLFTKDDGQFRTFDSRHGFLGDSFYRGVINAVGEIILATEHGVQIFHPDSLNRRLFNPPLVITLFNVYGEPRFKMGSALPREIGLAHHENFFAFEFAALTFIPARYKQYQCMLEGLEDKWVDVGERNYTSYTNVPHGSYRFKVRTKSLDGVWNNEKSASVAIIITPPWWKTGWAYLGFAVVTLALLYSIRRFEKNREHLKHQMELKQVESAKLREVDQMKSRFFANISHEFRTPLTLIEGPARQMALGEHKEEPKEIARMIARNSQRLLRLVNQLLDLSKIESGQLKLQVRELDIVDVVRGVAAAFESMANQKEIQFSVDYSEKSITSWFDQDAVEKIVTNLLSNAFKFTAEGMTVAVKVGRSDTRSYNAIAITVSDTGIGIPASHLDKIFDRFYHVDDTHTRDHEGTGIGLALSKELVELHRGTIDVQSEQGRGTTFTVRLPFGKGHYRPEEIIETPEREREVKEIAPMEPTEHFKQTASSKSDESHPLVLIIEDNADMRRYIRTHLEDRYRVLEATNGAEGVDRAVETVPDIIISDLMMPKLDGFQVCQRLKTDERTSHIPIILLTAKSDTDHKIEGLETGADDYLVKPFDEKEILVRIRNLIEQRRKLRERFRRDGTISLKEITITSADERFLKRATEVVESHIADRTFSTDLFAKEMFLSRMQLHRKIKALTDHSPGEFVRLLRLERASQLLLRRSGTIAEIAYQVAFDDPAYFSEVFHRQFGLSPTEFMQNRR